AADRAWRVHRLPGARALAAAAGGPARLRALPARDSLGGTGIDDSLEVAREHQAANPLDRMRRGQPLGTDLGAVHDRAASVEPEGAFEEVEPFVAGPVAAVDDEAEGLKQACRAHELVRVPPVGRAGGRTAGAENAFVKPVQLGALLGRLEALALGHRSVVDDPGTD